MPWPQDTNHAFSHLSLIFTDRGWSSVSHSLEPLNLMDYHIGSIPCLGFPALLTYLLTHFLNTLVVCRIASSLAQCVL